MDRLRIESTGPTAHDTKIWLNGEQLTGCYELSLHVKGGPTLDDVDLNRATIKIAVDGIEVDTATMVKVAAALESNIADELADPPSGAPA